MNDDFALLPWEYRGSGADLKAHAVIPALEVGGKTRRFLVKMRDGVIYFKDAGSGVVFAVLKRFENDLGADEMVEVVRENVAIRNFGRYFMQDSQYCYSFFGFTPTCLILNYTSRNGWIKEWFETEWHLFSRCSKPKIAFRRYGESLYDRAMNPDWRGEIPLEWVRGSESEMKHVLAAAFLLFRVPNPQISQKYRSSVSRVRVNFRSSSPLRTDIDFYKSIFGRSCPALNFKAVFEENFVVRGLTWTVVDWERLDERAKKYYSDGLEKWGNNWRRLWLASAYQEKMEVPFTWNPNSHERLEAALELREWLQDKLPEPEIDNLLRDALK